jgi:indole-3-glycerol phosphate synthase
MTVLGDILTVTRQRVQRLASARPDLERAAVAAPSAPSWTDAFRGNTVAVIAEVKRRSPSAGSIAPALQPGRLARSYANGGAAAISVLTDGPHFGGDIDDLTTVRHAVPLPVLRKDFLIDPVQLFESRAAGASAVLLIVRALAPGQLKDLSDLAVELGLGRLVEVHTVTELDRAVALEPEAIGVNSRDLDTFRVTLDAVPPLVAAVPAEIIAVAESGISGRDQVTRIAAAGADAVLVGTAVAGAADPAGAVADLCGVPRRGRPALGDRDGGLAP